MKKHLIIFSLFTLFYVSNSWAQVTAAFTANPKIGCSIPHTVFFTDASIGSNKYYVWTFGDGSFSNVQNPVHNYLTTGIFVVQLTLQDSIFGTTDIAYDTVKVSTISADFTGTPLFGCGPLTTNFTDGSTSNLAITSWAWDFGDGGTSTLQNPSYTYQTPGVYTLKLTSTNINGCTNIRTRASYVQVIGPDVNFGADQTIICPTTIVNFTDSTIFGAPITSWTWSFGDGSPNSNLQNPSHTYTTSSLFNISLIVTDIDGCSRTFTQSNFIDSRDIISPVITCPGAITINADVGVCTSTASIGIATSTDNCGGAPTVTNDAPVNFPIGNTTVTWTATDSEGNIATCTQVVTVTDVENPEITCPATANITTDAGICTSTANIGAATGIDNCGTPTITNNAPASFPIGNTNVTWTSTDGAGNFVTCVQVVTVTDAENPTITCPTTANITTDAGVCTSTANIGAATGTDNCGISTITNNAPANFPIGNTTVIWTTTDGAGNTATCTQIVTVIDNENPIITCPITTTINTDTGVCTSSVAIGTATGTDNCGTPNITNNAPVNFPIGNTTVTWAATDGAGNTATCTQIVTVIDNENPVITCPVTTTINTDTGVCTSTASIGTATATDNCGTPNITNNAPANFPIGNTTVTWTATDGSGNTASCTQIVTVVDAEVPAITCPIDITVDGDNNCEIVLADYTGLATATDNCDISPIITQLPIAGTTLAGANVITLTATDNAGNANSCNFNIIINDTVAPIVNCLADQVEFLDENCEFSLPDYSIIITTTDNCDIDLTVKQSPIAGTLYSAKEIVPVIIDFIDAAGNSSSCNFNVDLIIDQVNSGCGGTPVIATLLSPNGDGKNDTWIIRETNYVKDCIVMVVNRWGQTVFETTTYDNSWNANGLPDGDYYYVINCPDGESYTGPLTILRTK